MKHVRADFITGASRSSVMSDIEIEYQLQDTATAGAPVFVDRSATSFAVLARDPSTFFSNQLCGVTIEKNIIVAVVGHVHHGKSTFIDTMVQRVLPVGRAQRPLLMDSLVEEQQRGLTLQPSCITIPLDGSAALSIIDTPGHTAFNGSVRQALPLSDTAVLVVDAIEGCLLGTQAAVAACADTMTPVSSLVITGVDRLFTDHRLTPATAAAVIRDRVAQVARLCNRIHYSLPHPDQSLILHAGPHRFCVSMMAAREVIGIAHPWEHLDDILEVYARIVYACLGGDKQEIRRLALSLDLDFDEIWRLEHRYRHGETLIESFVQQLQLSAVEFTAQSIETAAQLAMGHYGERANRFPHFLCESFAESGSCDCCFAHEHSHFIPGWTLKEDPSVMVVRSLAPLSDSALPVCRVQPANFPIQSGHLLTTVNVRSIPENYMNSLMYPPAVLSVRVTSLHPGRIEAVDKGLRLMEQRWPGIRVEKLRGSSGQAIISGSSELLLDVALRWLRLSTDSELLVSLPFVFVDEKATHTDMVVTLTQNTPVPGRIVVSAGPLEEDTVNSARGLFFGFHEKVTARKQREQLSQTSLGIESAAVVAAYNCEAPSLLAVDSAVVCTSPEVADFIESAAFACATGPVCGSRVVRSLLHVHDWSGDRGALRALSRRAFSQALLLSRPVLETPSVFVEIICPTSRRNKVLRVLEPLALADSIQCKEISATAIERITCLIFAEKLPGLEDTLRMEQTYVVVQYMPASHCDLEGECLAGGQLPPPMAVVDNKAYEMRHRMRSIRGLAPLNSVLTPAVRVAAREAGCLPPALE